MSRILIACEESQEVLQHFIDAGHDAWSCDLMETSGPYPERHLQQDVLPLLKLEWELIIGFPPCTDLAGSGARWWPEKVANGTQQASVDFFMAHVNANAPLIAVENPVGLMSNRYRKPDQIINPWQFGHGEQKRTCLWLKGLPHLVPTDIVEGRDPRIWRMGPSSERSKLRSKTYPGIAKAMFDQWSPVLERL